MHLSTFTRSASALLLASIAMVPTISAQEICESSVSEPIVATLDDSTLFSTCAQREVRVQTLVSSLFDVLQFADKDFLIFCRSADCLSPVRDLVDTIPPNCLINYHGSVHNLSHEVSVLHHECIKTTNGADGATEDDMSRYFLDY